MRWRNACFIGLCLISSAAMAEAPSRDTLNATLKNLEASQQSEKNLRKKLDSARKEVDGLRKDATSLAEKLQASERKVTQEERKLGGLNAKLAAKQRDFDARKADYASTLSSLLRVQRVPPTALAADPDQLPEVLRTARVLQQVNGLLAQKALRLRDDLETLEKLRGAAEQSKQKLARESATLNEQQKRLQRDLVRRQQAQEKLGKDHAAAQRRVSELSKESASLQELIGKLEADRLNVAERGKAKIIAPPPSRGSWKVPVSGTLAHKFGQRKSTNETYRGLVWQARAAATVVAPAGGEVVFTGPFRDYGRMVLIKHGNNKISLLAGLGRISVSLNQAVGKGEPLGAMGESRINNLYYELREGSKPIDPAGWFANLGTSIAKQ